MSSINLQDLDQALHALLLQDPTTADMTLMYTLAARIEDDDQALSLVAKILSFMEHHPQADFGAPGPLVHFVEKFYQRGYEQLLMESFVRRPTPHTAFMVNRLVNGSSGEVKAGYLVQLREASRRRDIDEASLASISSFVQLHIE